MKPQHFAIAVVLLLGLYALATLGARIQAGRCRMDGNVGKGSIDCGYPSASASR